MSRRLYGAQRVVGHRGAEVAAADADVDDVADRAPGVADVTSVANGRRERGHPVEHTMHFGDDVDAVHDELRIRRHPQCHVQDRPVFGHVDVLAPEHGVDAVPQTARLDQGEQEAQCLRTHPVLGVIEVPARRLHVHLRAVRLLREQILQRALAHAGRVRGQRVPGCVSHGRDPRTASAGVRSEGSHPTGSSP